MYKTNFNFVMVEKILFDDYTLGDSDFARIKMADGTLNPCSAMHIQSYNTTMSRANIKNTFLDYSNLYIAYMAEVNPYKAVVPCINLFRAGPSFPKLDLIDLEHVDLSHVSLNKATLQDINLIDSKLFLMRLTSTSLETAICTDFNTANANFNSVNLSNCHFNCSVLTKAQTFSIRLYRVNSDEANVQGMNITILCSKEDTSINSDTLVTLQKPSEEDCAIHIGMSQTEDNLRAVAMKITVDITQGID